MNVLVLNCGSTSLKAEIRDTKLNTSLGKWHVERIGNVVKNHGVAVAQVLAQTEGALIHAVGHRVVHGGEAFTEPTQIDDEVVQTLELLVPLAPLHVPANLQGIRAARAALPDLPHVAVFDTAFHATLPNRAKHYAIPEDIATRHGIRRYGFHGPSHAYVARQAALHMDEDLRDLRVITLHLGGGCSATAVEYGRSVETSMGMTPLEGLVMGTRSGDVDAGALIAIARAEGLTIDELDSMLNRECGLAGLSDTSGDLRDIEARAAEGDPLCRNAINVFAHRIRKYIGAYAAVMGGVDAIVFTAGIGENSALIRHRVAQRLDFLGARIDEDLNRDANVREHGVVDIGAPGCRCRLLVVATDEASEIASQAARVASHVDEINAELRIPIAISARHVHLDRATCDLLFGEGYQLTKYKDISQPGQFACNERVDLVGPRKTIERVRILGPLRRANQVEVSRTDEFTLGIDAPIRNSGDVANSPGITLRGPNGTVTLTQGVIQARRHIHMQPADAERMGVNDRDVVEVAIDSNGRDLVFGDVLVRVSEKYALEMHVDTDEANAAELTSDVSGALVSSTAQVRITRRR
ncbi:MAG: acetate/propionate family kinase [Rhodobacterales bacterium]|nr:acetate/propionate family kinase [Rhodobacterales bacterium]